MTLYPPTLDAIVFEDWPVVHTWASLEEVCRYQPWGPNTEAQTREFVAEAVQAWSASPQERFPYIARVDGEVVGIGELRVTDRTHLQGDIGYGLHPRFWGRGLGTAIARELLARGFGELGLHRISATCDPRNIGSARVLEKVGMTAEGRLRHTALLRDGWRDSLIFSVLENEWARIQQPPSEG